MPTPGMPSDWISVTTPQANRSALISTATCSGVRLSARPMISGTATAPAYITSTCCSPRAVSYTHLDVYKRQQQNRSALISTATCSGVRLSARPMISGTATAPAYITSTCCSPRASRRG